MKKPLGLFEGFGVELEYVIVNKHTLKANPITDEVIKEVVGEYTSDYEEGEIAWSNELVLHVIELKTNGPAKTLSNLNSKFYSNIQKINTILEKYNSMLLPSGAHPFYNPDLETKLWQHENNPVYESYNRIFNCKGHGWSNLQSTHINLPFANDEEFGKLHAAIRLLLPIIPAIAASTPILDSSYTGYLDSRLEVYRKNQIKIPSITGKVIPERVFTQRDYSETIYKRIYKDIAPYDQENILQHEWLNSRGAIARWERNTIEIRVVDIQECPKADLAITGLFSLLLKELIEEKHMSYENQKNFNEDELAEIFLNTIKSGENTVIDDIKYLRAFGIDNSVSASELWQNIYANLTMDSSVISKEELEPINIIMTNGTLASRISKSLGDNLAHENLVTVYRELSNSLAKNEMFVP